jgi:aldehyde dehydrogenase (NAD+)
MGPLITQAAQNRVLEFIRRSESDGSGRVILGGSAPSLPKPLANGYFVEPTIFDSVEPDSSLAKEEIFGPVFALFRFQEEAKVLEAASSTRFGLANYVHTRDLRTAHRVAAQLKSGTVYVNDANRRNPGAPFGGYRSSGIGSEGGRAGLDEFLRKKTVGIA